MKRTNWIGAGLFVTSLLAVANGQTPDVGGVTVLRAGRVFDSESGVMLSRRDIVVRGGAIEAMGETVAIPTGARVIDLTGATVLPGLIDAHTHLLYLERPSGSPTADGISAVTVEGTPLRALHGAARARTFLQAGITTVRDLGNSGDFGDVALKTAINDGSVDGPRMFVSGPGLSAEGGQFPGLLADFRALARREYRVVQGAADAAVAVRENRVYGADVIKIYSDSAPNRGRLSLEEMQAIVAAARLHGVKVAAHATGNDSVRRAVEAGVDSIEHGYVVDDATLRLMKERGVALVPTDADTLTMTKYLERAGATVVPSVADIQADVGRRFDRLRRAVAAGVTVVAGSDMYIDMGVPQGDAARRVLFAYREAGLTPIQILQSATINAARLLGQPRLGAIKAGALADMIAVNGDPLADFAAVERVTFVMKGGRVYVGR